MRSKADIRQLNLPHETKKVKSGKNEKLKSKKRIRSEVSVNSPPESSEADGSWQIYYGCSPPESSKAGGTAVLLDALRQQHLLAVAEPLGIVRHPRDRLARAHLHVGVLVQPLVGALHQLPVSTASTTTVAAWRSG